MIQEEIVSPGYCFLQLLRSDVPLPEIKKFTFVIVTRGYYYEMHSWVVFVTMLNDTDYQTLKLIRVMTHGSSLCPSLYIIAELSLSFISRVASMRWPSNGMIRFAASNGCCVVGGCSMISTYPKVEWRISTS
jgi:hypothetical protein